MAKNIAALYENGVLRPLTPLKLREQQTVYIQIVEVKPVDRTELAIQSLIAEGVLTPPRGYSDIEPPTEEERQALADKLGNVPGKPLSQIILEERGPL